MTPDYILTSPVCGCHEFLREAQNTEKMVSLKNPQTNKAFAVLAVSLPEELYGTDSAFLVQKLSELQNKDLFLWGPEAKLISDKIYQEFLTICGKTLENIKNAFMIPENDVETPVVSIGKIQGQMQTLAVKILQVFENVEEFLDVTLKIVFNKSAEAIKAILDDAETKRATMDEQWRNFMVDAMKDHLRAKFGAFPENILGGYVTKLIDTFLNSPKTHIVDRLQLAERLDSLMTLPKNYFDALSDVAAGRIWAFAGIQQAADKGYIEYQIDGYMDSKICTVCSILNGKIFSTESVFEKMALFLDDPSDDDIQKLLFPFPSKDAVGGRYVLPSEGFLPPFHVNCRCSITLFNTAYDAEKNPIKTPLQMIKRLNQTPAKLRNLKALELAARETTDKLIALSPKAMTEMELLANKAGKFAISDEQKAALKGKTLLKSSVSNEAFNTDAIELLIKNEAKELRVITNDSSYNLKIDWELALAETSGFTTTAQILTTVKKVFKDNLKTLELKYKEKVASGEMAVEEATEKMTHLAMRYTAQEYSWLMYSKVSLSDS